MTSTDGPGWAMKMSDRIAPPGLRSSHHTGRVVLFLGGSDSESAAPGSSSLSSWLGLAAVSAASRAAVSEP